MSDHRIPKAWQWKAKYLVIEAGGKVHGNIDAETGKVCLSSTTEFAIFKGSEFTIMAMLGPPLIALNIVIVLQQENFDWLGWLVPISFVLFFPVYVLTRRMYYITLPITTPPSQLLDLCQIMARWFPAFAIMAAFFVGQMVAILDPQGQTGFPNPFPSASVFGGIAFVATFLMGGLLFIFCWGTIRIRKVKRNLLFITGIHKRFLATLPEWHGHAS